ncbi:MAG: c-type cytochrome, partial [Gemmatimonadales bacterium]
ACRVRGGGAAPPPSGHGMPCPYALIACVLLLAMTGCRQDMHDQPKYQPFERNAFFADQRASRALVPGVVARGHLDEDQAFFTGKADGAPVSTNPLPLTRDVLLRGQERFDIYCSPCHDRVGGGEGMIVQRGYKQPPSLHSDRLRSVPDGYLFQVMTKGFGGMPSYAPQVSARDRWAIAAYIRALQYSQHATLTDVPESERAALGGSQ